MTGKGLNLLNINGNFYIVSQAFEKVVMAEEFPKASIRVDMQVVEAHAGTRCAAMTAASVALADAGIPMRDMIPACASGKVNDVVVLDLNKEEDMGKLTCLKQ